jgi:hypothetical protein
MADVAGMLRWPRWKRVVIAVGIGARYVYDSAAGWRRRVSLRTPARSNARGGPPTEAEFA